jgi:hypothetical protein
LLASSPAGAASLDSDRDGMPDTWEKEVGLNRYRANASEDPDRDGLTNLGEYRVRSHPRDEDPDNDGIDDGDEVRVFRTSPRLRDQNRNGRLDGDDDANRNGIRNEDEDDTRETCAADDDDRDRDGIDDEGP